MLWRVFGKRCSSLKAGTTMDSSKGPRHAPLLRVLGWRGGEVICARRDGDLRRQAPAGRILYLAALHSSMRIACSNLYIRVTPSPPQTVTLKGDTMLGKANHRLIAGQRG